MGIVYEKETNKTKQKTTPPPPPQVNSADLPILIEKILAKSQKIDR